MMNIQALCSNTLTDLIFFHNSLFMYDYYTDNLPTAFDDFFIPVQNVHNYNTRTASRNTFYIPSARTNYRKFSIRVLGPKTWNAIEDCIKNVSKSTFKNKIKMKAIDSYQPFCSYKYLISIFFSFFRFCSPCSLTY